MEKRDYQQAAEDAVFKHWETHPAAIVVMATGLGKTILFAHIIKRIGKRALVIAHRRELIYQACERIRDATGMECEIEMGWNRIDTHGFHLPTIVVATVQSMEKRLKKWRPDDFGLVVVDEAHHGTASTYRKVLDHFKQNPNLRILGVTATPDRADEESLAQIFHETPAFVYDILDGVNDGWLVPVTQQFCPVSSLDISHVKTTAGDLNQGELARIMEAEENVQGVIQPTLEVLHGLEPKSLAKVDVSRWGEYLASLNRSPRRSLVFTVSVAQAEMYCNILNRVLPGCSEWICGETPEDDRKAVLDRFQSGKTPVVCNCAVLTEGFDAPATECIFMAKPTKSRSLYTQMVGRSTRPLPGLVDQHDTPEARKGSIAASGKPFCRVVDFVGNSGRHKLICALDVLSGDISEEAIEEAKRKALEDGKPKSVLRTLTNAEAELEKKKREAEERHRLLAEARKRRVVARSEYDTVEVDPFGQQHFLTANGKHVANPCTEKQARLIGRYGINPVGVSKKKAGWIINILAEHNWMLPEEYKWLRNPQLRSLKPQCAPGQNWSR